MSDHASANRTGLSSVSVVDVALSTDIGQEQRRMESLDSIQQPSPLLADASRLYTSLERQFLQVVTGVAEAIADGVITFLAVRLAYFLYERQTHGTHLVYTNRNVAFFSGLFSLITVLLLKWAGDYRVDSSMLRVKETERLLFAVVSGSVLMLIIIHMFNDTTPVLWLTYSMMIVSIAVFLHRQMVYLLLRSLLAKGYMATEVAIYGAGNRGQQVFSALIGSPKLGMRPVAFFDDKESLWGRKIYESSYKKTAFAPVLAGAPTAEALRAINVKTLIVAIPTIDRSHLLSVIQEATAAKVSVQFTPNSFSEGDYTMGYVELDGHLLSYVTGQRQKPYYNLAKRVFDTSVAILVLLAFAPLMLLIALLIRYTSEGPVIFRQVRIGENGKPFTMYKFRSMFTNLCGDGHSPDSGVDPRITPVGRVIRKTSFDELPQLFNILKGNMSLVGPRPEMPFIVEKYTPAQRRRLSVMPGLTGLWQISADRSAQIHDNVHYDLYYIRNRGFFLDMAILLHTVFVAMNGV